ncbi:MAG: hypothetical protein CSA66_03390 [Proteobacteria bacterium]|nr:MAG: hypothetical protein CSA66_03390 [Pseudomonadota bacterium]
MTDSRLAVAVAVALISSVPACGDDRPMTDPALALESAAGAAVTDYLVVVSGPDLAPTIVACDTTGPQVGPGTWCDAHRLRLDPAVVTAALVKAPGYEHAPVPLDAAATRLTLTALPAPEVTDDYATGVADVAAFESLAVSFVSELGPAEVVKFYVDGLEGRDGPPTVYLQNTRLHPLHYDFFNDVVGPPTSRADFEEATYYAEDRQAAAGTLIRYADLATSWGAPTLLTFFPSDTLSPAKILRVHQLIEARAPALSRQGRADRLVYLPAAATREAEVAAAAAAFARADAPWTTQRDLYGDLTQQLLNDGVAYGTLRLMTPEDLETTVVSYRDVLVLTRLPNDLPLVGGTLTEELQTPLAHVNVAARGRGTPNMALLDAGAHPDVAPLLGQLVRFEVADGAWSLAAATVDEAQAFWDARAPEPFSPVADVATEGLLPFSALGFADADKVGVKAANLAELRAVIGDVAPDGFAVPFHYFDRFVAETVVPPGLCDDAREDCVEEGRADAVCDAAAAKCVPADPASPETVAALTARLLADADFNADTALREAALDSLRWLMRHLPVDATLAAALDAEVAARFGTARVRLRSSTNAEDLPNFSGAGLYTSVGADTAGGDAPSDEIRKVWASVWNWRAHEERAYWGIDHAAIRVGVAVHAAFPNEVANGVLITRNLADPTVAGYYVNVQKGETSVTNPTNGAVPEIFTMVLGHQAVEVQRQRWSSLSPEAPILTDAELTELYRNARDVQTHFAALYDRDVYSFALDMEFKLVGPDRHLIIKQVRPYTTGAQP